MKRLSEDLSEERLDDLLHAGVSRDETAGGIESERMRFRLLQMRSAASFYADAEWQSAAAAPARRQRRGVAGGLLGLAAALALVAGYFAQQSRPAARRAAMEPAARTVQPEASDEALLNGIHSDLSATIPIALKPLAANASTRQRRRITARKDQE